MGEGSALMPDLMGPQTPGAKASEVLELFMSPAVFKVNYNSEFCFLFSILPIRRSGTYFLGKFPSGVTSSPIFFFFSVNSKFYLLLIRIWSIKHQLVKFKLFWKFSFSFSPGFHEAREMPCKLSLIRKKSCSYTSALSTSSALPTCRMEV